MKALLIVDMQNDFMPGGSLAVPKADALVHTINPLMEKFDLILATQDWHPKSHMSFAANHPGKKSGEIVEVEGLDQILWPVHCVIDSQGAKLVQGLRQDKIAKVFHKGTDPTIDSYSTFFDNARRKKTGLEEYLHSKKIKDIYVVGVATDYCVLYSVLDAVERGFNTYVIQDGCKGIDLAPGDVDKAFQMMREAGAHLIHSKDLLK